MNESPQIVFGLAFFGLFTFLILGWGTWNVWVRGLPVRRVADEIEAKVESGDVTLNDISRHVVPSLISANSALAGITIAALFIVIGFVVFRVQNLGGLHEVIVYIILWLSAVAAICWLLCLELLSQMLAPSITRTRMFQFYRLSMDLWVVAMGLIIYALMFFLLLANAFAAIGTGLVTILILFRYWKIQNGW